MNSRTKAKHPFSLPPSLAFGLFLAGARRDAGPGGGRAGELQAWQPIMEAALKTGAPWHAVRRRQWQARLLPGVDPRQRGAVWCQ